MDLRLITHPTKKAFLIAVSQTGTVRGATRIVGNAEKSHFLWIHKDPDYAAAFEQAKAAFADKAEAEAWKRAIEGSEEPIYDKEGKQVGTRFKKSDLLMIFMLKGALPHKYRDNARIEHSGVIGHAHLAVDPRALLANPASARLLSDLAAIAFGSPAAPPTSTTETEPAPLLLTDRTSSLVEALANDNDDTTSDDPDNSDDDAGDQSTECGV